MECGATLLFDVACQPELVTHDREPCLKTRSKNHPWTRLQPALKALRVTLPVYGTCVIINLCGQLRLVLYP